MPPSPGAPDANMMMQQIQQLQKTVMQLQTSSAQGQGAGGGPGTGGTNTFRGNAFGSGSSNGPGAGFGGEPQSKNGGAMGGGYSTYGGGNTPGTQGHSNNRTWSNRRRGDSKEGEEGSIREEDQKVLLVSNIPPNLSNPDSLFYAFEKFGTVDRVKILHNKRNTALIQMSQPEEAHKAYNEQDKLNRVGTEIYVNFSSKFKEIKVPEPGSMYDDGLTKDYTGQFPTQQQAPRQNNFTMGQNYDNMGGNMGGGMGMFGGMNSMGGGGGNFNMDPQNYGFNNYGEIARINQTG